MTDVSATADTEVLRYIIAAFLLVAVGLLSYFMSPEQSMADMMADDFEKFVAANDAEKRK